LIKFVKSLPVKFSIILSAVLLLAATAGAQIITTNTFSQTVNAPIPMNNPNGYNTAITVSGITGTIIGLNVFLNVTNGYNGDLYVFLDDAFGTKAVLLNRTGISGSEAFGYGDSGFDITFNTAATNDIHFYQTMTYTLNSAGQLTGIWGADGRDINPESSPSAFDSAATNATLSLDMNDNPNGDWTIFVADLNNGYPSSLISWGIQILTVPEPSSLAICGLFTASLLLVRRRRK